MSAASPELEKDFVIRNWNKDHGLPQDMILAMLQSRDGYLWLGTHYGLARFDGLRFTVFSEGTRPDMPDGRCTDLAEDTAGNLWMGTPSGLLRWDGQSFTHLTRGDGLADNSVQRVAAMQDGSVWVAFADYLQRIPKGALQPEIPRKFPGDKRSLFEAADGHLWVAGDSLTKFHVTNYERDDFAFDPTIEWIASRPGAHGSEGPVWSIAVSKAQSRRTPRTLLSFSEGRWSPVGALAENLVRDEWMVRDRSGTLWMGGGVNKIARFRDGKLEHLGAPWSRSKDWSLSGLEDREGNLWIGTSSSGVFCLTPKQVQSVTAAEGLAQDYVRTVWPAKGGGIWAVTDGSLSRIGPEAGQVTNWTQWGDQVFRRPLAVAEMPDGTVWLGTSSNQIHFRHEEVSLHRFSIPAGASLKDIEGSAYNKARCLLPARDGSLWVAVPLGLHRLQDGQDQFFTTRDGLGANDVRALLQTRDGTVWAGTAGGGLSRYTGDPDRPFITLTRKDGLSRGTVWALAEDDEGILWAGTDGGLNRIEAGRITTAFDRRQGLPALEVNCLVTDDLGHLWVGHDRGIYRVRLSELNAVAAGRASTVRCVRLGKEDGLPVEETNGQTATPAACKTADGRLWFATPKGVVVDPRQLRENSVPPPVVIERVVADQQTIHGDDPGTEGPDAGVASSGPVRLEPGRGRYIEFHYTANTFIASDSARFRYRLEGHEDEWHDAGTRRLAQYIGLQPGAYRFRVLAGNHHDAWNDTGAAFDFVIEPFYWQTRSFQIAMAAVGLAGIAGLVVIREREVRRVEALKRQAAQGQLRARVAADLHDGLGSSLARLHFLADGIQQEPAVSPEIATRLGDIASTARELARTVREIAWNANPGDASLNGLIAQIAQNAQDVLSAAGVPCRLDIPPDLPATRLSAEQRSSLFFAAKEAVTNIARHARATAADLFVRAVEGRLILEFRDDGAGFEAAAPRHSGEPPRHSLHGGNGLPNLYSRIGSLGGRCVLQSRPGSGTRVRFEIPLANLGETAE
ncbi:MAG: hypothetical protein KIT22_01300 [Verrucomicrobiae bacterium]|nr:hypothetical protein [Verrucomicrobiae bacterium]